MNTDDKDNKKENEENIPEPVFHETENFRTAYFGKVPDEIIAGVPQKYERKLIATLVSQLTNPESREIKDEVLKVLRDGESQELLIEAIDMKDYTKHRQVLLAACWESGLDFSKYLEKFISILGEKSTDNLSCLEIVTIIEEMPGPFEPKTIEKALNSLDLLSVSDPLKKDLLTIVHNHLQGFKS
jgi:hypothetical protein